MKFDSYGRFLKSDLYQVMSLFEPPKEQIAR